MSRASGEAGCHGGHLLAADQESRLPAPIRGQLYDEVKPLAADLCLGIGGLNDAPGRGDLFFFALSRDA